MMNCLEAGVRTFLAINDHSWDFGVLSGKQWAVRLDLDRLQFVMEGEMEDSVIILGVFGSTRWVRAFTH
jgi:hypothetical protein